MRADVEDQRRFIDPKRAIRGILPNPTNGARNDDQQKQPSPGSLTIGAIFGRIRDGGRSGQSAHSTSDMAGRPGFQALSPPVRRGREVKISTQTVTYPLTADELTPQQFRPPFIQMLADEGNQVWILTIAVSITSGLGERLLL